MPTEEVLTGRGRPSESDAAQPGFEISEPTVSRWLQREAAPWVLGPQRKQLLTQCEILQDEVLTRTNGADHPAVEVPQQREHGGKSYCNRLATGRHQKIAKLLI